MGIFFFIVIQRGFANAIRDNDVFEMFVLYIIKLNFNISSVSSAAAACRRVGEEDEGTGGMRGAETYLRLGRYLRPYFKAMGQRVQGSASHGEHMSMAGC